MIAVRKPEKRMKTVIKLMDQCLDKEQTCAGCEYTGDTDCLQKLMADGLYYLRMALEKSEGKR